MPRGGGKRWEGHRGDKAGFKGNQRGGRKTQNDLIDEIRKKNNSVDFADVTGKMKELATDQNGSRYIQ